MVSVIFHGEGNKTYNIGQLSLGDQILRLSSDKFLLQCNQLRALWLLDLQLCNLVRDLSFVVSAGLHALLGIPDGLQDGSAIIDVVCIQILLLAQLGKKNANLVGDIADGIIVCSLAPIGELSCDGETLLACGFVALDQTVLGLDQLVELLAELGLNGSTKGAEAEAMTGARCGRGAVLVGTDGECSIPGRRTSVKFRSRRC